MKNNLFIACLTFALAINAVPTNAQSNQKGFAEDVIKGVLVEMTSEAARIMLRAMFSSDREARNPAFTDGEYLISIINNGNDFVYYGVNLKTKDSVSLRGVTTTSNSRRQTYSWVNDRYRYQVAWQPRDPDFVRLQVFGPNGKQLMNRLLQRTKE